MSDLVEKRVWSIDLCEDNLRDTMDAPEAVLQLKELLKESAVSYNEQKCIHSCRPCHAGALIVRVNDELVTGDTSADVVRSVIALVIQRKDDSVMK